MIILGIRLILVVHCIVAQNTTPNTKLEKSNISATTTSLITISTFNFEQETIDLNVTTETTLMPTCEGNSSCFSSTLEPSTNETSGKLNITIKSIKEEAYQNDAATSGKEFCACNLQLNICDVNCCCDQDCSTEDKLIFHHCKSENVYYDTRYCEYMKYIYINNTPFQWHVNQNGLFCVLKSNLPPSHIIQRQKPLSSLREAEQEKQNRFSWPQTLKNKEVKFNMKEKFLYGNNVWIVHKNEIKKFRMPKKYFSNTCIIKEDILNLKNMKNLCSQIDISEENEFLHFRNYFQNISVVANPHYLNSSKYKNIQECPKNICLTILPKICDTTFNNCQNISRNDSRVKLKCNFDLRKNTNHCINVVKSLKYNFYHNGTKGYIKVELLGVLEEVSYEFGAQDFEFFQEFEINFWWTDQTRNYSAILSGNPGYLIGKPILSGHLVNIGNATDLKWKVERNFSDYLDNFLTVPENVRGKCVLNNSKYLPVQFGYNIMTKCEFSATIINQRKYHSGTEMCKEVQKKILSMWGITNKNKTVGIFGNANSNIHEDWIKIMPSVHVKKLLNRTTGQFSSTNTTLTCFGLVNNVIVDIYHSRIDFKTMLNQEKILGVVYSFATFINKSLSYNKHNNSTYFEMDLESQVVFYDISVQKRTKFVDRPNLEMKLPYDFFYPFIKIDNGVGVLSANMGFHISVCLIVLLMH